MSKTHPMLNTSQLALLRSIYSGEVSDICGPSLKGIARRRDTSIRSLYRCLAHLTSLKLITRHRLRDRVSGLRIYLAKITPKGSSIIDDLSDTCEDLCHNQCHNQCQDLCQNNVSQNMAQILSQNMAQIPENDTNSLLKESWKTAPYKIGTNSVTKYGTNSVTNLKRGPLLQNPTLLEKERIELQKEINFFLRSSGPDERNCRFLAKKWLGGGYQIQPSTPLTPPEKQKHPSEPRKKGKGHLAIASEIKSHRGDSGGAKKAVGEGAISEDELGGFLAAAKRIEFLQDFGHKKRPPFNAERWAEYAIAKVNMTGIDIVELTYHANDCAAYAETQRTVVRSPRLWLSNWLDKALCIKSTAKPAHDGRASTTGIKNDTICYAKQRPDIGDRSRFTTENTDRNQGPARMEGRRDDGEHKPVKRIAGLAERLKGS